MITWILSAPVASSLFTNTALILKIFRSKIGTAWRPQNPGDALLTLSRRYMSYKYMYDDV